MTSRFLNHEFLRLGWYELRSITDKWGFIRQAYMEYLPEIIEHGKKYKRGWFEPYVLDWECFMNKVEKMAWESIRGRQMVLYPQFPLFNHFIDFANPILRIGLEVDGRQHDPVKDRERDSWFAKFGWKIFRVPAREAYTECRDLSELNEADTSREEKEEELTKWMLTSMDGVIQAIEWLYFADLEDKEDLPEEWRFLLDLTKRTLKQHRLISFPLK